MKKPPLFLLVLIALAVGMQCVLLYVEFRHNVSPWWSIAVVISLSAWFGATFQKRYGRR